MMSAVSIVYTTAAILSCSSVLIGQQQVHGFSLSVLLPPVSRTATTTSAAAAASSLKHSRNLQLFVFLEEFNDDFNLEKNQEDLKKKSDKAAAAANNPIPTYPPEEEIDIGVSSSSRGSGSASNSEIDWDAEWKKVVAKKDQPAVRPGKDFYKSEAEITAIRVANQAQERALEAARKLPAVPSWKSLQGDWKFWIGILAVVSIGFSILTAPTGLAPPPQAPESYYI